MIEMQQQRLQVRGWSAVLSYTYRYRYCHDRNNSTRRHTCRIAISLFFFAIYVRMSSSVCWRTYLLTLSSKLAQWIKAFASIIYSSTDKVGGALIKRCPAALPVFEEVDEQIHSRCWGEVILIFVVCSFD
jgi:hypothetical protein